MYLGCEIMIRMTHVSPLRLRPQRRPPSSSLQPPLCCVASEAFNPIPQPLEPKTPQTLQNVLTKLVNGLSGNIHTSYSDQKVAAGSPKLKSKSRKALPEGQRQKLGTLSLNFEVAPSSPQHSILTLNGEDSASGVISQLNVVL